MLVQVVEERDKSPGWCGSVGEQRSPGCDSQPGHVSGLWARSLVGGV